MNAGNRNEEEKMFEGALNSVLHMDKKDYPAYVGGLMVASGNEFIVSSPVDKSIIFGRFQDPEDDLADKAVAAAQTAFKEWSKVEPAKRAGIFEMALDSVKRQRYRLAAAVIFSSGMTKARAIEEVDLFIKILEREIEKARKMKGKPMGVWAIVSEYNTPFAAPAAYAAAAMLAGNSMVMIPSKHAPVPMFMFFDILRAAMLPAGVFNLVVGRRNKLTALLTDNENISGIVAAGSGERMEDLMFIQTNDELRFVNEIKGMNPVLVYKPKNMAAAAESILKRAFSFSGQDVSACSKVIVTAEEQKQFIDALLKAYSKLTVNDPADDGVDIGPVISELKMDEFLQFAGILSDNVIAGGKPVRTEADGYYVKPMILTGLHEDHEMNVMDHSLPILSIQSAGDLEEAMEMINGCEFGLFSGIYSRDENAIKEFREIASADNLYENDTVIQKCALNACVEKFVK